MILPNCRLMRHNRPARRLRRSAFTLLELLVVIGIIALLVGMLIPSLTAARRESRRVVCQANIKQVVLGWHGFLEENHGFFLRRALADVNYGGRQGASKEYRVDKPVNKHLKLPRVTNEGAGVFDCPDDDGGSLDPNATPKPAASIEPSFFRWYGTSYLANPLLIGPSPYLLGKDDPCAPYLSPNGKGELPLLNAGQLDYESKLLLVADGGWQKTWNYANREPIVQWHGYVQKHNVGFMDGHVDYVAIRKGIYVTSQYTVLPTTALQNLAIPHQATPKGW